MANGSTTAASNLALDDVGTGKPLVFIHGLTFSRATWRPVIDLLADSMRCISIDLPAHGDSPGDPTPLERCAELIRDRVASLGIDQPVVIGHSMGASIAMIYAGRYPVRGAVVVDQTPLIVPFAMMLRQVEPMLRNNFDAAFAPIRQSIGVDLLSEPLRSATLATQTVDRDLVLGYWDEVLTSEPEQLQQRIDDGVNAISAPVLYVAGHTLPDPDRDYLKQHLPQMQLEEWDGSGHMVHLAHVDRFADAVRSFVDRIA
jgi:pimeloyl-ACP methyl ester carboxylesterase